MVWGRQGKVGSDCASRAWKGLGPRASLCAMRHPFQGAAFLYLVAVVGRRVITDILQGLLQAVQMIVTRDPVLMRIVVLSLRVSGTALLFSTLVGIPLGALLGLSRFHARRLVVALLYTGMGFPPVVVGLFVYVLLSRSGPLGRLNSPLIPTLFTPSAMVLAQTVISFPLVAGFTMAAVMGVDPQLRQQVQALGATRWQTAWTVLSEARVGVIVSMVAGFGSIISEVGAVMMVGGNIEGSTRVLTTAIVLETNKGQFGFAMALGFILLALAFIANVVMLRLQGRTFEQ